MHEIDHIPDIVRRLYALVAELHQRFPHRPFTPDGHLVGSLGEVLAEHYYGLKLLECSTACHDAETADGKLVQIKATQKKMVAMRAQPDHLLVILLKPDGTIEEIYNGPGEEPWTVAGAMGRNGQRPISVAKLRSLMVHVSPASKLPLTGSPAVRS